MVIIGPVESFMPYRLSFGGLRGPVGIWITLLVYDLKCVGPLEFELVKPMPEQLKTTTMHFYEAPRKS